MRVSCYELRLSSRVGRYIAGFAGRIPQSLPDGLLFQVSVMTHDGKKGFGG